ncbi:hypothetical protein C5167_039355 [Papaver somniferum]|uniref:F-box domain-containing protein n=1 Tax=Papaver somniferum TaxID=3469 RepID=A0A4Y7IC25_PAPSO|nr:putative FBD-associated F-box protein At1g78730 [Papaver somniferum]RZC46404.1 hypothetical protein C5167_039355 [Papaver somniferum]
MEEPRNSPAEDRISILPQKLIHHILSFLDMTCVVRTCVLAKVWRYIWASVPVLNFDSSLHTMEHSGFLDFIDRVFVLRDSCEVQRFNLVFSDIGCDKATARSVNSWIFASLTRGVEEVSMDIRAEKDLAVKLPSSLFNCKSLSKLELKIGRHECSSLVLPSSIGLPCLKFLKLESVSIDDENPADKLFSSCPALESLVIKDSRLNISISSVTLKHFELDNNPSLPLGNEVKIVKLDAPNLTSFSCKSCLSFEYCLENLTSLVIADINMVVKEDAEELPPTDINMVVNEGGELPPEDVNMVVNGDGEELPLEDVNIVVNEDGDELPPVEVNIVVNEDGEELPPADVNLVVNEDGEELPPACVDIVVNEDVEELPPVDTNVEVKEDTEDLPKTFSEFSEVLKKSFAQNTIKLLRGLHSAKNLALSPWFLEVLSGVPDLDIQLPVFVNLRSLKLQTWLSKDCFAVVISLLKKSPNIESLSVEITKKCFVEPPSFPLCDEVMSDSASVLDCWEEEFFTPGMLSHLRFLELQGVIGSINELKFVEILLKNTVVLEVVSLHSSSEVLGDDLSRFNMFCEKVTTFPSASSSVYVKME